jgi:glycosyltransferase involved in cell wall biosynthesis
VISVLLPTRSRPKQLATSIRSLFDNGLQVPFEILIAADPDDEPTLTMADHLGQFYFVYDLVRSFVMPERFGYVGLHEYYNRLANEARGDWLLLWNDDAVMTTPDWNGRIEQLGSEALVADLQHNLSPQFVCFPAMRRSMYDALGHFTGETPHVDSYIQDIARALGRVRPVEVWVDHERPDLTGRAPDATFLEGRAGLRHQEYFSAEFQAVIGEAVERVRAAGV